MISNQGDSVFSVDMKSSPRVMETNTNMRGVSLTGHRLVDILVLPLLFKCKNAFVLEPRHTSIVSSEPR